MAVKVSLINMKGGVGKSTLAVQLSFCFASLFNKKVLLVDLDPQFNASQYLLGIEKYTQILNQNKPTVWDVFEQYTQTPGRERPQPQTIDPVVYLYTAAEYHRGGRIDLIPSRLELASSLQNPAGKEQLLAKLIPKIEDHFHLIIIDCPPTESVFTIAAYLASDYILVPVKPEYLSTIGLPLLVKSMNAFKTQHEDHKLELAGVVFNACSQYAPEEIKSKNEINSEAEKNGWYVFENEISYSRSYPKSAREGKPIFGTSYVRYGRWGQIKAVANEFAERIDQIDLTRDEYTGMFYQRAVE